MSEAPDLVPTLAVLGLFADGPSTVRGVAHLRLKESDRLEVLAENLRRLGRPAKAIDDRLEIGAGAGPLRGGRIETRSDHRMAMAFAVAGLRIEGVEIDDPDCVSKSNPVFWDAFGALAG
jgi:3-phosphoshikimate 1-carboxyvinyltransferase